MKTCSLETARSSEPERRRGEPMPATMRAAALSAALLLSPGAWPQAVAPAQSPSAIQRREIQTQEIERRREEIERRRRSEELPEALPKGEPVSEGAAGARFTLSAVRFSDSAILERETLQRLVAPYLGTEVDIGDIRRIVESVNELYRAGGHVAKAVLPAQEIAAGVVRITLVEAKVAEVEVRDARYTREGHILSRFSTRADDLANLKIIERDLIRFNKTSDIRLKAQLRPGPTLGTTAIDLLVEEPPRYLLTLGADNRGSRETGERQAMLKLKVASVLGFEDRLRAEIIRSGGIDSRYLDYSVPVYRTSARVTGFYSDNATEIRNGPFAGLRIEGDARLLGMSWSAPLLIDRAEFLELTGQLQSVRSETRITGVALPRQDVHSLSLGFTYQYNWSGGLLYTYHSFTRSYAEFDERYFSRYSGGFFLVESFLDKYSVTLSGFGQASGDHLLPGSELFQIGGATTVRGYSAGLLAGDQGYVLRAEAGRRWYLPELAGVAVNATVDGYLLVDHGAAFPFRASGGIRSDDFISSTGVGVRFSAKRGLSGVLELAFPLDNREPRGSALVHFQIEYSFSFL